MIISYDDMPQASVAAIAGPMLEAYRGCDTTRR